MQHATLAEAGTGATGGGTTAGAPRHASKRRGAFLIAVLLFTAFVAAYFAPVVFGGEVLLPWRFLYLGDPVFAPVAPPGPDFEHTNAVLASDRVYQFHPWLDFNLRTLRSRDLPLWNPLSGAGSPHVALDQTAVFDPLSTGVGLLLGKTAGENARALLAIWLAGVGMLLFSRRRGLSTAAGLLAALAFAFGGWFIAWLGRPMTAAACWLPWILWGLDRQLRDERPARESLLVAIFVALSLFAGHIETTAHILLLAGAYALFQAWRLEPRRMVRRAVSAISALVAGIGLGAVAVLPFATFLLGDAGGPGVRGGPDLTTIERIFAGLQGMGDPARVTRALVTAVIPVLNFPRNMAFMSPPPNLAENTIYVGVGPLLLALVAAARLRNRADVAFWIAVAATGLALALALPVFHLINQFPVIRWTAVGRLRMAYSFGAAMLAGYGLDQLRSQAWRFRPAMWLVAPLLLAGASWTADLLSGASTDALVAGLAGWVGGIAFLVALATTPRRLFPTVAVLVCAGELITALHGVQGSQPVSQLHPPTGATDFLRKHPGERMASYSLWPTLPPLAGALASHYGLASVTGYDVLYPERFRAFMKIVNRDAPWRPPLGEDWARLEDPGSDLVDLLGIRFLVVADAPDSARIASSGLRRQFERRVWADGSAAIYENPDPLPRAFLVHEIRNVSDAREAADSLARPGGFDFRRRALVEGMKVWPAFGAEAGPQRAGMATLIRPRPTEVEVRVSSPANAILVFTEAYVRGWRCEIDGEPAAVLPTNLAFVGVPIPPGEHVVRLRYEPASFRLGLLISAIIGLLLAGLVTNERRKVRSGRIQQEPA